MKKQDGFPGQLSYVIPDKILEMVARNLLIADLYITDIGYYPQDPHHFRERKDGAFPAILIYTVDGKGVISTGNSEHELLADHFFIIPPGMSHAYYADKGNPWSIYWVHFAGPKAKLFSRMALQPIHIERGKLRGSMNASDCSARFSRTSTAVLASKHWNTPTFA